MLLVYPGLQAHRAQAEDGSPNSQDTIPDLGRSNDRPGNFSVRPNGATLDNRFDGKRLLISPEYSDQTGLSLGGAFAFPLGDSAAGGLLATAGAKKNELLFNAGFQMDEIQRLVLTIGQLRQYLDIDFFSGKEKTEMTQNNGAVSYQHYLGKGLLNSFEVNGYLANTPSRDLGVKNYVIDTATEYAVWNDHRRVAGGRITGLQGKLIFTPLPDSTFKLGAGGERMEYDYLTGKQSTTRATGSAEWRQQLVAGLNLKAGADVAAAQNRYTIGVEGPYVEGWKLGADLTGIRGRDGAPDDNQFKLTWSHDFGGKSGKSGLNNSNAAPAWGSLLDQVAKRPSFLPAQVVAKLDTTATRARPAGWKTPAAAAVVQLNTGYLGTNGALLAANRLNTRALAVQAAWAAFSAPWNAAADVLTAAAAATTAAATLAGTPTPRQVYAAAEVGETAANAMAQMNAAIIAAPPAGAAQIAEAALTLTANTAAQAALANLWI